jgi:hypothetical protein
MKKNVLIGQSLQFRMQGAQLFFRKDYRYRPSDQRWKLVIDFVPIRLQGVDGPPNQMSAQPSLDIFQEFI